MVGIELVTDQKEKTPAKAETAVLFEKLRGTCKNLFFCRNVPVGGQSGCVGQWV